MRFPALLSATVAAGAIVAISTGAIALVRAPFFGARPSQAIRVENGRLRAMSFRTPIQHVVVIVMENRTVDNLFAGYYAQPFPSGGTWGSRLNLYDPNDKRRPLTPNSLSAAFDPSHTRDYAFPTEAAGNWDAERFGCRGKPPKCPKNKTAYSYVPTMETQPYAQIVENWEFANSVLQANEGPSLPAHQYLIAGQSGGIAGSLSAPFSEAENIPNAVFDADEAGDFEEPADLDAFSGTDLCRTKKSVETIDMVRPYRQSEKMNPRIQPCEEYGPSSVGTVLDGMANTLGGPDYMDWQYIAHATNTIWAAPLGVRHLESEYAQASDKRKTPFAVDPDANRFMADLKSTNPTRPFAALTYVTPCDAESDHPRYGEISDGPQWLGNIVNAIGESPYWATTTIIVTWDDWGGFFDHVPAGGPVHPFPNPYTSRSDPSGNPSDPNEYGFRVPFMVISPYTRGRAYVSSRPRSYSAIIRHAESVFGLPSLGADDAFNDDLGDMFDFTRRQPLPYVPIQGIKPLRHSCK